MTGRKHNQAYTPRRVPPVPMRPDESLNSSFTAIPVDPATPNAHPDVLETDDVGPMNEKDARDLGYISENENADHSD